MSDRLRGGQPRAGKPAGNVLKVRLTDTELAQLDAYVAKHGRDRSHWVRLAMVDAGLLRRLKGARMGSESMTPERLKGAHRGAVACRDCGDLALGPGDKCLRCYHEDLAVDAYVALLSSQREREKQGPR